MMQRGIRIKAAAFTYRFPTMAKTDGNDRSAVPEAMVLAGDTATKLDFSIKKPDYHYGSRAS